MDTDKKENGDRPPSATVDLLFVPGHSCKGVENQFFSYYSTVRKENPFAN